MLKGFVSILSSCLAGRSWLFLADAGLRCDPLHHENDALVLYIHLMIIANIER